MNEAQALQKITDSVKDLVRGERINIISRTPLSRLEHNIVVAIVFKYDEQKEQEVLSIVKELTLSEPMIRFGGTEVDDKFNMEYSAVLVSATVK